LAAELENLSPEAYRELLEDFADAQTAREAFAELEAGLNRWQPWMSGWNSASRRKRRSRDLRPRRDLPEEPGKSRSGGISARMLQIPNLIAGVRFSSPAPPAKAQVAKDFATWAFLFPSARCAVSSRWAKPALAGIPDHTTRRDPR
jgi:hypothetical protein